jgi:hypothetical protein
LKCYLCGYDHLDIHDTDTAYVTYCQQCGNTTEAKRANPRRLAEIRKLPVKQRANRDSNQIIQLPEKRAKRR